MVTQFNHRTRTDRVPAGVGRGLRAQVLGADICVTQNPGKGAALQLSMERHNQGHGALRMAETHMAAALTDHDPSQLAERSDQFRPGDDRKAAAQAGSGRRRRTIPISRERPSSRSPSTYSTSASSALAMASSRVSPSV